MQTSLVKNGGVDSCSDLNATEGLLITASKILGELEKSNQETNWDPSTFSVTFVIGFVAVIFAVLTVCQAVIAATPSKHCTKYALGPWASFSKKSVEFGQMRMQATAYTPIIRMPELVAYLLPDYRLDETWGICLVRDYEQSIRKVKSETSKEQKHALANARDRSQHFPAT